MTNQEDPSHYLGDVVGHSIDKVTTTLATAQRTDDLNDWFFYGAAMGNVTMGVASVVAGAAGVARLATAGAGELSTLLRARINELAPDTRGNPFLAEQARSAGSPVRLTESSALPNTRASVYDKLDRYLLNPDHPVGGSKATWFDSALGFNRSNASALAEQIVFDETAAVKTATIEQGVKFNQVIPITGANGNVIDVTFGWIRNTDGIVRLTTSIPTKR